MKDFLLEFGITRVSALHWQNTTQFDSFLYSAESENMCPVSLQYKYNVILVLDLICDWHVLLITSEK